MHSVMELSESSDICLDFINCDKTLTPSFQKRGDNDTFLWIFQEELVILRKLLLTNENLYFIMLLYISLCVCECVFLFSGGWCVALARCGSCQDVEGEQPASGRVGCKAKGPSVIFNTSATSLSSGTMVTSQNLPPPSDTVPFYLFFHYSPIPML